MELNHFIKTIPLSDEFIDANKLMMDFFDLNSDRIEDGGISNSGMSEVNTSHKITKQIYFSHNDKEEILMLHKLSNYILKEYSKRAPFFNRQLDYLYKDYCIKRYKINEGFHAEHIDNYSQHTNNRIFACIWYLNDIEKGGETEFTVLNRTIKPKKDNILIFPCNYLYPHQGCVPLSGDRYIITWFICSPTASDLEIMRNPPQ